MYWMRSGTELSQFLRVSYLLLMKKKSILNSAKIIGNFVYLEKYKCFMQIFQKHMQQNADILESGPWYHSILLQIPCIFMLAIYER